MRLVDGDERDVDVGEPLQKIAAQQPLGTDVEQVEFMGVQPRQHPAGRIGVQRGIVERRGHAVRLQGIHLVLHQRNQRRDDDADAGPVQRGDLVAERLAAAGRHQHEGVPSGDQFLDDRLLVRAESGIAEDAAQRGVDVIREYAGGVHGGIVRPRAGAVSRGTGRGSMKYAGSGLLRGNSRQADGFNPAAVR